MATATAVRPVRATTAADLAAYKLPEPPADPARLAGMFRAATEHRRNMVA